MDWTDSTEVRLVAESVEYLRVPVELWLTTSPAATTPQVRAALLPAGEGGEVGPRPTFDDSTWEAARLLTDPVSGKPDAVLVRYNRHAQRGAVLVVWVRLTTSDEDVWDVAPGRVVID